MCYNQKQTNESFKQLSLTYHNTNKYKHEILFKIKSTSFLCYYFLVLYTSVLLTRLFFSLCCDEHTKISFVLSECSHWFMVLI